MAVTFKDHFEYTDDERRPLLTKIRETLRSWDNKLDETITPAQRIAYKKPGGKVFLEIKVQKQAVVLHMVEVPDPDGLLSRIPASHGWRQLALRGKIRTRGDLERLLPLIRAAYWRG